MFDRVPPSDRVKSAHPRFYFSSTQKWWVTISLAAGGNEAANGCVGDAWNTALRLEEFLHHREDAAARIA